MQLEIAHVRQAVRKPGVCSVAGDLVMDDRVREQCDALLKRSRRKGIVVLLDVVRHKPRFRCALEETVLRVRLRGRARATYYFLLRYR